MYKTNITNRPSFTRMGFGAIILVAVAFITHSGLTPIGSATSPDSISYFDAAKHIRDGHGFVATNYFLDAAKPTTPLTTWPPLYSYYLSLFMGKDVNSVIASARAGLVSLTSSGILIYLILLMTVRYIAAIGGALTFLVAQPILTVYSYAWSESLFITLLLLAILLSFLCIKSTSDLSRPYHKLYLILFATTLAALFYCRYIGFLFAVLLPATWLISKNPKLLIKDYVLAGTWYTLLVIMLPLRNYIYTGQLGGVEITGVSRAHSNVGMLDSLSDLRDSVLSIVPNSSNELFITIVATSIVMLLLWLYSRHKTTKPAVNKTAIQRQFIFILLLSIVVYIVGLLLLRTLVNFDRIDVRYISIPTSLIIVLLFLTIEWITINNTNRNTTILVTLIPVLFVVGLFVQGLFTYRQSLNNWREFGDPKFNVQINTTYNNFTRSKENNILIPLIGKLRPKGTEVLITEAPAILLFLAGLEPNNKSARYFPSKSITQEKIDLINSVNDGWVVLTNKNRSLQRLTEFYGLHSRTLKFLPDYAKYRLFVTRLPLPKY